MYTQFKQEQDNLKKTGLSRAMDERWSPKAAELWKQIIREKGCDFTSPTDPSKADQEQGRIVRVFISSTFKDFYWEREVLIRQVFPQLRTWCEERNIYLIECDLRWGVPREATGQEAILTCLEEIDKCREETFGANFFLGLIGDRYGWTPTMEEVGERIINKWGKYNWIEGASVTLMEILQGSVRTMSPNAYFMIRNSDLYDNMESESLKIFKDTDPITCDNMLSLRNYLCQTFGQMGQLDHYSCTYAGMEQDPISGRDRVKLKDYETFSESVLNFFTGAITRNFDQASETSLNKSRSCEDELHMVTLRALTRFATGQESILKLLLPNSCTSTEIPDDTTLDCFKPGTQIVCLRGPAGSGKSTAMARLILQLKSDSDVSIFYHFIGSSTSSKVEENMIDRFEEFVNKEFPRETEASATGDETSKHRFVNLLKRLQCSSSKRVFIVIDALDEITSENQQMNWLPFNFPENVYCIVSCLETSGSLWGCLSSRDIKTVSMEMLDEKDSRVVAAEFFKDFGKRLDEDQMNKLVSHPTSNNPLWLMQACEELRIHGDYSSLNKAIIGLPDSIDELNKQILRRIIQQDSTGLTKLFFQILYVSRVGIWETEVRRMISVEEDEIPQATWHTILRGLKSFVHVESVPIPVIKFRHRIMKEAVFDELFTDKESVEQLHVKLANYYETKCTSSKFKGLERTFHLYYGNQRNKLVKSLRTKDSFFYIPKRITRSQIMSSMRCSMMTNSGQKENALKICTFCANRNQGLSIWGLNKDCCIFCGQIAFGGSQLNKMEARVCPVHESQRFRIKNDCIVCERPCMGQSFPAKVCTFCASMSSRCCSFVLETDFTFNNQKKLAQHTTICW